MSPRSREKSDKAKLVRILGDLPFAEEDKARWVEIINGPGLDEFTIKEIQAKLPELPEPGEEEILKRKRRLSELNLYFRNFRLTQNLAKFRKR